jgi:hypothetical protein
MKLHQNTKPLKRPVVVLSVEEEAILEDQLAEAAAGVSSASLDAERISGIQDVNTDLSAAVADIPEVGAIENELINSVAEMAVAGTDTDPDSVFTVTGNAEPEVTTEGIVSFLASLWDTIVKAIKNFMVSGKHFLTTLFSSLNNNVKHCDKLIDKLDAMKGFIPIENSTVESTDWFDLAGGKPKEGIAEFAGRAEEADKQLTTYVNSLFSNGERYVTNLGGCISTIYKDYNGGAVEPDVNRKADEMRSTILQYAKSVGISPGGKGEMEKTVGGLKVEFKNAAVMGDSNSPFETKVAYLSRVRIDVTSITKTKPGQKVTLDVKNLTPDQLSGMVKKRKTAIEELIGITDKFEKKFENDIKLAEDACAEMLKRIKPEDKEGQKVSKHLMQLTNAYSNWILSMRINTASHSARINKFWLSFYEKASNCYKSAT